MSEPVRLHKREQKEDLKLTSLLMDKVEAWILNHAFLFLFVLMALLIALFVCVIYAMTGISAVESGGIRNFMVTQL